MPELVAYSAHYLYPSTLFASPQASEVITVLGSCVSVCLWDRRRQSAGINHYMLPFWNGEGLPSPKFGNIANSKLLEKMVALGRLNFIEDDFNVPHEFDIIFCRNVLIYFDKITQEKVINRLCAKLIPGGYFFLGHSESVTGMEVPLVQIKPTVFQKI